MDSGVNTLLHVVAHCGDADFVKLLLGPSGSRYFVNNATVTAGQPTVTNDDWTYDDEYLKQRPIDVGVTFVSHKRRNAGKLFEQQVDKRGYIMN